jgi:hypothetical protein
MQTATRCTLYCAAGKTEIVSARATDATGRNTAAATITQS